jgi:hypothetical protein
LQQGLLWDIQGRGKMDKRIIYQENIYYCGYKDKREIKATQNTGDYTNIIKKWTRNWRATHIKTMITVKFKIPRGYSMVTGACLHEERSVEEEEECEIRYEKLQNELNKSYRSDYCIISGTVGRLPVSISKEIYREPCYIWNEQQSQRVVTPSHLKVANTFFNEDNIRKCTWSQHGTSSLIDYVKVTKKL